MPKTRVKTEKPWISCLAASRRLGVTPHRIRAYALTGRIATKVVLGQTPAYAASDVEKLRSELAQ